MKWCNFRRGHTALCGDPNLADQPDQNFGDHRKGFQESPKGSSASHIASVLLTVLLNLLTAYDFAICTDLKAWI